MLVSLSCNSEKKETPTAVEETPKVEEVKKELNIEIKFKTDTETDFKWIVSDIVKDEFQKKTVIISETMSPTPNLETFNANFGENIMSNNIRFDLGSKELKEVEIGEININYGKNSLNIPVSELKTYFVINKFIAFDEATFKLKTQRVDGKHFPSIFLKRSAINTLTKE